MSFVFDKEMKARKQHSCVACHEIIPNGFVYVRSFWVDGGDKGCDKWHVECRKEFTDICYSENYGEGFDPWDTWEAGLPDEVRHKYGLGPQ